MVLLQFTLLIMTVVLSVVQFSKYSDSREDYDLETGVMLLLLAVWQAALIAT